MKRIGTLAVAALLLAVGLACGGGQQSCGRKDLTRYVHKDGHTTVEHCVEGPNGLHWEKGN